MAHSSPPLYLADMKMHKAFLGRVGFPAALLLVALVASGAAWADELWDRTTEKLELAEALVPAEARIEGTATGAGQERGFSSVVKARVVDGKIERELIRTRPESGEQTVALPAGSGTDGNGRIMSLVYGLDGSSPFAGAADLVVSATGKSRTIGGERTVLYSATWSTEGGYRFTADVWLSPARQVPVLAEVSLQRHPWGSELRELRLTISYTEALGLPVRDRQILEARLRKKALVTITIRATTQLSGYFAIPEGY